MTARAISEEDARSWGDLYGRQCVKTHETYPDEITCRGTLERTSAMFGRSFDEPAFQAFFEAAKQAANEDAHKNTKFKIGDRVRVKFAEDSTGEKHVGKTGKVVGFHYDWFPFDPAVSVEFDDPGDGPKQDALWSIELREIEDT